MNNLTREQVSDTPIKNLIFKGLKGCGDNSCLIQKPKGMATNGGCRCIHNRSYQSIVFSRVNQIDIILEGTDEKKPKT